MTHFHVGAGKSLCYQLPALVLPGTVLVVSPLLALMQDQLAHVPACIPAAMLGSSLAPEATRAALSRLQARVSFSCHWAQLFIPVQPDAAWCRTASTRHPWQDQGHASNRT